MTSRVVHEARYPNPNDLAPWGNYLLLPITIPADIATLPIQVPFYYGSKNGCRHGSLAIETNVIR